MHGQFPLPDAWVWRRTAIQRGWRVRLRAGVLMACAFALVGIAAYGWMTFWPMLGAVSARCTH